MKENKEMEEEKWVEKGQIKTVVLHVLDVVVLLILFTCWYNLFEIVRTQL